MEAIIKNNNVVSKTVQDEEILLNLDTGVYFGLNSVGTQVWKCIESGSTQEELINHLCEIYSVPYDEAKSDVVELLEELKNHNLLQL